MSDFTSAFWGYYVGILTIVSVLACVALLAAMSTQTVKKNAQGKTVSTGHVWDEDLAELNNPLPRWWMWLFYITLVFAGGYLVLYPGAGKFAGTLGWSSKAQYDEERAKVKAETAPLYAKFADQDIKVLAADPQARAIGERLFRSLSINSWSNSIRAARSTCGAPMVIPAHVTGSSIHAAMETTTPAGPWTFKNRPFARCSTRRMRTVQPKYGCHR